MKDSIGHYKFEIDFGPVQEIPLDPKARLPLFTAFKTLLKQEKEKIQAWHRLGAGGREVIQAHTSLIDKVIRHLITLLVTLKPYSQSKILEEFALVAVGGYGRGEMNPFSDIDLLFLRPEKFQKTTGVDDNLALLTASLTQSWMGISLTWQARKISPSSTSS